MATDTDLLTALDDAFHGMNTALQKAWLTGLTAAPTKSQGHVFVADDEEDLLYLMREFLEAAGYEVTTFDGSSPRLPLIDWSTVDAALIDLRMPTPGLEVAAQVALRNPETRLVFYTAASGGETRPQIAGIPVFQKPLHPDTLIAALTE